jgi:thiol-disulfide isomerase/thioredoxin
MSKIPAGDTAAILAFQQKAITRIMASSAETNVQLQLYLQQVKNAEVLSYGLINYGFENDASNRSIIALVQKLKAYKSHPLAQSIVVGMQEVSKSIEHTFLSKNYQLINGGSIKMDTIHSRFILMDFWASWCMPCRKSIRGDLKMLRTDFKEDELFILGINTDQNKPSALQAIEKDDNKNTQIWDGDTNELYNYFNVKALPHYILIDTKTQDVKVLHPADMVSLKSKLKEMLSR